MNYKTWLKISQNRINNLISKFDIELLLSFVTKKNKVFLLTYDNNLLSYKEYTKLKILLEKIISGKPISYLIGTCEFWSIKLLTSKCTIIPRKDTEILVEISLNKISLNNNILDLGTGIGPIALSIAKERKDCYVIGTDIKQDAIEKARYNANKLKIFNVKFLLGNWFEPIFNKFSIIVSNPPYISYKEYKIFKKNIKFEPKKALVSKEDGMQDLHYIIKNSIFYLKKNGWLLLEHGFNQGLKVYNLLNNYGFKNIKTYKDYGNNNRVSIGQF